MSAVLKVQQRAYFPSFLLNPAASLSPDTPVAANDPAEAYDPEVAAYDLAAAALDEEKAAACSVKNQFGLNMTFSHSRTH